MDFQLARNLSAIGRAQENVAQSLLHIEATIDCLNRDIIVSAACSEATEQLLTSARALLLQVQSLLATQSDEGSDRLREAQISFLMERQENRSNSSYSHDENMTSSLTGQDQASRVTDKEIASDGHSYANTVVRGGLRQYDDNDDDAGESLKG